MFTIGLARLIQLGAVLGAAFYLSGFNLSYAAGCLLCVAVLQWDIGQIRAGK